MTAWNTGHCLTFEIRFAPQQVHASGNWDTRDWKVDNTEQLVKIIFQNNTIQQFAVQRLIFIKYFNHLGFVSLGKESRNVCLEATQTFDQAGEPHLKVYIYKKF